MVKKSDEMPVPINRKHVVTVVELMERLEEVVKMLDGMELTTARDILRDLVHGEIRNEMLMKNTLRILRMIENFDYRDARTQIMALLHILK